MSGSTQFLRRCSLLLANAQQALDLSALHIKFHVTQSDVQTPNLITARVYNLSKQTVAMAEAEYTDIVLQAGYQDGPLGVIFKGTTVQTRWGRENPTDTYLDIIAADGDFAYNQCVMNQSLAGGSTSRDRLNVLTKAMAPYDVTQGYVPSAADAGGTIPRGKVLYGMARDHLRVQANSIGTTWSIQNGQVQFLPLTGYLPGEAVVLTSQTGMIGIPEQTQDGILVRCLINPLLRVGGLVRINNDDIQRAQRQVTNATLAQSNDEYFSNARIANLSAHGFYRVYVLEHAGDTRGEAWYSDLICLAVDATAAPADSVQAYG